MGSELGKPSGQRMVRVLDLAVILLNVWKGAQFKSVGFEDADQTLAQLIINLRAKKKVGIRKSDLESCLWSCNLMHERGKFWHPEGKEFGAFLDGLLENDEMFDRDYNYIKKTEDNNEITDS